MPSERNRYPIVARFRNALVFVLYAVATNAYYLGSDGARTVSMPRDTHHHALVRRCADLSARHFQYGGRFVTMRWGISGRPLSMSLPYFGPIERQSAIFDFPPCLAYAVAWRESIRGEVHKEWDSAATVVSADGGHGLFQLTSWYPDDWDNPDGNAHVAIADWLLPDAQYGFRQFDLIGDDLVRFTAAAFNAGLGGAIRGHELGNVDAFTTEHYGQNVLRIYQHLVAYGTPE